MIKVIIELELVFPYKVSMATLADFCHIWGSTVWDGGTNKLKAVISIPGRHFKTIFGQNPREQAYPVPSGTGHFISALKVKEIVVKWKNIKISF